MAGGDQKGVASSNPGKPRRALEHLWGNLFIERLVSIYKVIKAISIYSYQPA